MIYLWWGIFASLIIVLLLTGFRINPREDGE